MITEVIPRPESSDFDLYQLLYALETNKVVSESPGGISRGEQRESFKHKLRRKSKEMIF